MPSIAVLKLIGIGVGLLAVVGLFAMVMGWRSERNDLRLQVSAACEATKEAASNPKLGCKDMPKQIRELGTSLATTKAALARQSAAVDQLAADSTEQQKAAAEASRNAMTRAREAEATAARLRASSRSSGAQAKPCDASETLKGSWR